MPSAEEPSPAVLSDSFAQLTEAVLSQRPVLRELVLKHGRKTLVEYASLYTDVNLNPPIQSRQDELVSTFTEEVAKRFGPTTAQAAARQLIQHYFVSTTDHMGMIVNQSFTNANLLTTASYVNHNNPTLQYVVVLPCANITFSNITFPRGLIFNSVVNGQVKLQRLAFIPSNAHNSIVYNFRPYTRQDVDKVHGVVRDKQSAKEISNDVAEKLHTLLDEVYAQPTVLEQPNYSEQVIQTNYQLWQKFAPSKLIYLEQETLTTALLIKYHLHVDTIISNIILKAEYTHLLEHYFAGIMGAFDEAKKYGTFFFWGITSDKHYRVQLWRVGNELRSDDGSIVVPLTPAGLQAALQAKQIIPSLLLVFTTLCFYYGLKCLGGFNQINYLTAMKNAYIKMNVDRQNYRSIEVCARAQTKEMNDGYLMAFGLAPNGGHIPATGLDLYLYGTEQTWPTIQNVARNLTVEQSLQPALVEFYRFVYPEPDRVAALTALTAEQVVAHADIDQVLQPCISFT